MTHHDTDTATTTDSCGDDFFDLVGQPIGIDNLTEDVTKLEQALNLAEALMPITQLMLDGALPVIPVTETLKFLRNYHGLAEHVLKDHLPTDEFDVEDKNMALGIAFGFAGGITIIVRELLNEIAAGIRDGSIAVTVDGDAGPK